MKNQLLFTTLFLLISILLSVGCNNKTTKPDRDDSAFEEINDPFQALTDMSSTIIDAGGVASVGQGTSKRMDIARKKAVVAAQGNLASVLKTKLSKLNKSFQEEIGSRDDTEINEAFTDVVKAVSKTTLSGAIVKKVKYLRDKETGMITAAAVVAIEPDKIDMSLFDEIKKSPKLYERFRASQAYKDLEHDMEAFDKDFRDYEENILEIFLKMNKGQTLTKNELSRKMKQTYIKSKKNISKSYIEEQIYYLLKKEKIKRIPPNHYKIIDE